MEDALQRIVHDADNAEHDQEVQQHGHTACHGIVAVLLLQLEHLCLLLFGLILVLVLDLQHHGLECRHFCGTLLLDELERDLHDVDEQGEEDNVPAVIGDQLIDPLHHIAERGAQDVKEIHTSVHSAPPVARDLLFFYRRTRRPQFAASQEADYFSTFFCRRVENSREG